MTYTPKLVIENPATKEQVEFISANSPHVRMDELGRLMNQAAGLLPYEPRTGGQGQHLRCKNGNCGNISLAYGRKQLCPTHYAVFLERSNRAQAMPMCSHCNQRTRNDFEGVKTCPTCRTRIESEREVRYTTECEFNSKLRQLDDAETVDDLRNWIKEYMLKAY